MRAPRSTRCPRCGFSFAWNGRRCGHCPPPSRARQLWEQIDRIPELVGSGRNIPSPALLAIAFGCLRRVRELLPSVAQDLLQQIEADPGDGRHFGVPDRPSSSTNTPEDTAVAAVEHLAVDLRAGRGVIEARTVQQVAHLCAEAAASRAFPERELLSFPLPPELERHRAALTVALGNRPHVAARRILARAEDNPLRMAYVHLNEAAVAYQERRRVGVRAEGFAQCEIARDVLGYPEVTVTFDPAWRTDTTVAMARGMLASRDFSAMPILADALQDAGCEEPEILEHCRAEKPHFPGCWVLERILGG